MNLSCSISLVFQFSIKLRTFYWLGTSHHSWCDIRIKDFTDSIKCRCRDVDMPLIQVSHYVTVYLRNESPSPYGNIMYDRRIVRGNTYAQRTLPAVSNNIDYNMVGVRPMESVKETIVDISSCSPLLITGNISYCLFDDIPLPPSMHS